MIIACDVDNVLNNLTESILKVYNSDHNDNLKVEDITSYGIENFVKPEFKADFPRLFLDKRVWKGISVVPNCIEVLKKWHDKGHEIYFVTATNTENMHKKAEWLQRTFPFIDVKKYLICMQKKQMLGMSVDVLIDDCLDNLIEGNYIGILFNYPWNRQPCESICRASNWIDIDNLLERVEEVVTQFS